MSKLKYDEVLKQLRAIMKRWDTSAIETVASRQAADEYFELVFADMNLHEFHFIVSHLGHEATDEEVAKLVVAAASHEDLSEVLPISADAKIAYKFRHQRTQQHLTQQQVAEITGNFTQSQIAKAEAVDLPLTLTRWSELFRAIGQKVTIQIG